MIIRRNPRPQARRGATVVEAAAVLSVFVLFVLGLFEYGRFVMLQNLVINATREGCRYAVSHCADANVQTAITNQVRYCMFGLDSQLPDLAIAAFPTDNPTATLDTANPDDPITVRVTGTFTTIFPSLLFLPTTIQMRSSSIMTCEGN